MDFRVAVDATPALTPTGRTGVGVFVAELIRQLAPHVPVVAYAATGRRPLTLRNAELPSSVEKARWWLPMPAGALQWAWERRDVPRIEAWTGPVAVVHGTNFVVPPAKKACRVVTVHDLSPVHCQDTCTPADLRYPPLIERAVAGNALVHTPSKFVAEEVVERFGVDRSRVFPITPGLPTVVDGDPQTGRRLAGAKKYILAIGTQQPRKNFPTLIAAFDRLAPAHPYLDLVIAGDDTRLDNPVPAAIADSRFPSRLRSLGWVDEEKKASLLRGAVALACPSRYEGFGFPVLEAMQVGLPVVATTAGALPEVAGDAAVLVPPGDPESLTAALDEVLQDDDKRAQLAAAGHRNAERFSWTAFTSQLLDLYNQASDYTAAECGRPLRAAEAVR